MDFPGFKIHKLLVLIHLLSMSNKFEIWCYEQTATIIYNLDSQLGAGTLKIMLSNAGIFCNQDSAQCWSLQARYF